jgi:hypothetical protein
MFWLVLVFLHFAGQYEKNGIFQVKIHRKLGDPEFPEVDRSTLKSIERFSFLKSIDRNSHDVDRSIIKSIDRIYAELEFQKS